MPLDFRYSFVLLTVALSVAIPATAAEPTEDMRTIARMFAALEARDQKAYCEIMHGPAYTEYLGRVCQMAMQNNLKKSDECSTDRIAQELRDDKQKCLAMPATEFDQTMLTGREASGRFIERLAKQGVDGEKLLREARDNMVYTIRE